MSGKFMILQLVIISQINFLLTFFKLFFNGDRIQKFKSLQLSI